MRAHKVYCCKGRVNFLRNEGDKKSSCTFGTCVVIFKKHSHKWAKLRPLYHKEKDLTEYKTIDDFCRTDLEKDRERQLSVTDSKNTDKIRRDEF